MEVHIASTGEERRRLYEFRYKVQVEEIGLEPYGTFHKLRAVRDDFDVDAEHFYVSSMGEIVGTLRVLLCAGVRLPELLMDAYGLERFSDFEKRNLAIFDDYIVAAHHRDSDVPGLLYETAYRYALENEVRFMFCYTSPSLVPLFEKLGYRRYTKNFVEPNLGLQTPLVLVSDDTARLQKMNSPLAAIAAEYDIKTTDGEWIVKNFPLAAESETKALRDISNLWPHLTAKLHQPPLVGLPLFVGMSVQDAHRFLKNSLIVNMNRGEHLLCEGDIGNEMYVILSGEVDVRYQGKRVANFSAGAVIGEISFLTEVPRTADVQVIEDAEFLVLTQSSFQKVMRSMPEIAARVLFNLSLILCERLQHSTESWIDGIITDDQAEA